ncbi:MAG: Rieske 2Fe-2S domain-containing protein [Actinomycetota bacterium]|nr:Rieske 2Fe-2S domain-containing protein [Actinomycetota bacterium]
MTQSDQRNIGDLSHLENGELISCEVDDFEMLICRVEGKLYAIEDNCSHADTPLSEGKLSGFQINCPLHGASFDVRDGSHSGPPAYTGVRCFEIAEGESGVSVIIESKDGDSKAEPQTGYFQTR